MKTILWTAAAVVLLLAGGTAAATWLLAPVDPAGTARLVIVPPGSTAQDVGRVLAGEGLVRDAGHFVAAARLRGASRALRPGEYRFSPAMSLLQIVDILARGDVVLHSVTIPEGFTAEQIVQTLASRGLADARRLREVVRRGGASFPYDYLAEAGGSLEGYLFPDTYRFPRFLDERTIVAAYLARFDAVVVPLWRREGAGRSLHEIVTMASLVEREARVPGEQPLIAGVLYNRLRRGWKLEVDATVLYALGTHKPVVTFKDLTVESPYNTYRHAGLPPGPIASPGLGAVRAALRPTATDFLFYVAREDGSHVFSRTLAEHNAAIQRYRRP